MRLVPMRAADGRRPATRDEQIVHSVVFGECIHRSWNSFTDKLGQVVLACSDCGGEFVYDSLEKEYFEPPGAEVTKLQPSDFLLTAVRNYADEEVLASLIIRQVELAGWQSTLVESGGIHTCSIERGEIVFRSGPYKSRPAAVCSAAALCGASGQFQQIK